MRNVTSRTIPLMMVLGVVGLLGGAWLTDSSRVESATLPPTAPPARALVAERVVWFESRAASGGDAREAQREELPAGRSRPAEEMAPGDAGQFAMHCQLRLLAADTDLDLSHHEWATLSRAVIDAQAVRLAYEAEIARVVRVAPGHWRVEIPSYAEAGDELRRRLWANVHEGLGAAVAQEVRETLGRKLEARFAGFGVSAQTLEISGDPAAAPGDVTVQRTARFWDSIDGSAIMSTRHEVHFPAFEDPAGEQWTPLLALVGKTE